MCITRPVVSFARSAAPGHHASPRPGHCDGGVTSLSAVAGSSASTPTPVGASLAFCEPHH
jgi:hypothetical protein